VLRKGTNAADFRKSRAKTQDLGNSARKHILAKKLQAKKYFLNFLKEKSPPSLENLYKCTFLKICTNVHSCKYDVNFIFITQYENMIVHFCK
jgi:hypothetical protein